LIVPVLLSVAALISLLDVRMPLPRLIVPVLLSAAVMAMAL